MSEHAAARRGAAAAPDNELSCRRRRGPLSAAGASVGEVVRPPCCCSSSAILVLSGEAVVVGDLLARKQVDGGADEHARARERRASRRVSFAVAALAVAAAGFSLTPPLTSAPADQLGEAVGSARVVDESRPASLHRRVDHERRAAGRKGVVEAGGAVVVDSELIVFLPSSASAAADPSDGADSKEVDTLFVLGILRQE